MSLSKNNSAAEEYNAPVHHDATPEQAASLPVASASGTDKAHQHRGVNVNGAPLIEVNMQRSELEKAQCETRFTCRNCNYSGLSQVTKQAGNCTYLSAFGTCLICCPCAFIPFCIDDLKDSTHSCPQCGEVAGVAKRL